MLTSLLKDAPSKEWRRTMLVCKVQSTPAGVELTDSGGGDADDDKSVKDTDRGIIDPDTTASKTFNT